MNIFHFALYLSLFIWGIFYNWKFLSIFATFIGVYLYGASKIPNSKYNSTRSKLRIASWTAPEEGNIRNRFEVDVSKALEFLEKNKERENKMTITHIAIRAVAEILKEIPDMNGKISFGKFIPYDSIKVGCLVDIGNGKDLAAVTIDDCDKKSLEEIADFLKLKAAKVRKYEDKEHNKRTNAFYYVPTAIIKVVLEIVNFVANRIGLDVEAISIKKYPFGAATVTSLGMLGIKNCFSPHNMILRGKMIISVNEIENRPVAIDGKAEIRPMLNLNFIVDHRYVDGGRTKTLADKVTHVFNHPEEYSSQKKT